MRVITYEINTTIIHPGGNAENVPRWQEASASGTNEEMNKFYLELTNVENSWRYRNAKIFDTNVDDPILIE